MGAVYLSCYPHGCYQVCFSAVCSMISKGSECSKEGIVIWFWSGLS